MGGSTSVIIIVVVFALLALAGMILYRQKESVNFKMFGIEMGFKGESPSPEQADAPAPAHNAPAPEPHGGVSIEDAKAGGGILAEDSTGGGVKMKGVEAGDDIIASSSKAALESVAGIKTDVREIEAGRDVTIIGQQTIYQTPPSPSPTSPPDSPPSRSHPPDRECEDLKKTLDIARRALRHLERQKIVFGLHAPPHILIEIEDKEMEIRDLETRMDALECE